MSVANGTRSREITHLPKREMRAIRRRMQLVFQDPAAALDPKMTIAESLAEPLIVHALAR